MANRQDTGTNLFDGNIANGGTVDHGLADSNGNWVLVRSTVANIPAAAAGYATGCLLQATDTGNNYVNQGTPASSTFTLLEDAGGAFTLPVTATDGTTTTGSSFLMTESVLTTGNGLRVLGTTANFTTNGKLVYADMAAAVAGNGFVAVTTGVYTGTGLMTLTATAATIGTLALISGAGLTSGTALSIVGGGANMLSTGQTVLVNMGLATTGQGLQVTSTGVYSGLNGIVQVTANSADIGTITRVNGTGLTSGNALYVLGGGVNMISGGNVVNTDMGTGGIAGSAILAQTPGTYTGTDGVIRVAATATTTGLLNVARATAATLTGAGRYYSANDGDLEVFGVGANGHLHNTQTTAPGIAVTQANGISAAAITAGGSDTCGTITTTGTNDNNGTSILQVTFNKTYTAAPKAVILQALNTSAAKVATTSLFGTIISAKTATTFDITIPQDAAAGATPSWTYQVIA
jgi:hypothetical protein